MQPNLVSLTVSNFANGRDAAVGLIYPAARYACVLWIAESRLERRQIADSAWPLLELEIACGYVPRRLPGTSAVMKALFNPDRRRCMTTEYVSRFPFDLEPIATIPVRLGDLMARLSIDARPISQPARVESTPDSVSQVLT